MQKTLVIAACSKLKQNYPCKMTEFYLGDLFKKSLEFAQINNFDFMVISGKLGIISPVEIIEPYDQKIKTKKDIKGIKELSNPKLNKILPKYEKVFLILGNNYFQVISDQIKNYHGIKFFRMISKNGIFDYKVNIRKAIQQDYTVFYELN